MHRAPMSPSEPAEPFLKLLFRLMKTTLVRKKTQLNDKMTQSKIWQIQKRFVILSFILKRSCYFWRFLEKFSDFLCSNFGTLTTTSKIQMKYVWWQNRMTKWHFFALNPITRMFERIRFCNWSGVSGDGFWCLSKYYMVELNCILGTFLFPPWGNQLVD